MLRRNFLCLRRQREKRYLAGPKIATMVTQIEAVTWYGLIHHFCQLPDIFKIMINRERELWLILFDMSQATFQRTLLRALDIHFD